MRKVLEKRLISVSITYDDCRYCGKEFESKAGSKYCTQECRDKSKEEGNLYYKSIQIKQKEEEEKAKYEKDPFWNYRHCDLCGKHFRNVVKRNIFCSLECKVARIDKLKQEQKDRKSKQASEQKIIRDSIKISCIVCGDKFTPKNKNNNICSDGCRAFHAAEVREKQKKVDALCFDSCPKTTLKDDVKSVLNMDLDDILDNFGDLE